MGFILFRFYLGFGRTGKVRVGGSDENGEPSSSVGLYFRIFAHFGSRVTLTVTLLSSQCSIVQPKSFHYSAKVISLSSRGHFIVLSF